MLVLHDILIEVINSVFVGLLAFSRRQLFNLDFGLVHQGLQALHNITDPRRRIRLGLFVRIQPFFSRQTLLTVGFRLGFLFANLELLHLGFNETPGLQQRLLVLDFRRSNPSLDLVSQPLELLDFLLEVHFVLFLLILLLRAVDLLPNVIKEFDALVDLFHDPLNLGYITSAYTATGTTTTKNRNGNISVRHTVPLSRFPSQHYHNDPRYCTP